MEVKKLEPLEFNLNRRMKSWNDTQVPIGTISIEDLNYYSWDLYKQVMKARVVRFYLQEAISFGVYNFLIREMR